MGASESHVSTNTPCGRVSASGADKGDSRVGDRGLFRGHALNAIDAKGRVAIPAPFRKIIEQNSHDPSVIIGKHASAPCLIGYDSGWAALLNAQIERREERALDQGRDFDLDATTRNAFGMTEEAGFDSSARFIVPPFLRAKAQLTDWALFIGTGNVFEIWNPHVLIAAPDISEDFKDLARFRLAERKVAL